MKRVGPRGSGQFERTTWDEALDTLAARIRKALVEERRTEIMYHVGRPGHDGYMDRVLQSWGVDGHNSHTNVCSGAARLGYVLWSGGDRPSPDYANAKFTLLLSSHLETGHYFNPHAQRIIEGKMAGAKVCTVDVRLSNTASMSDYWLSPHPGTEAAMLLGFAHVLLAEDLVDRDFVREWVNWETYLETCHPDAPRDFDTFLAKLQEEYASYTPEWVAEECGLDADAVRAIGREIGAARGGFAAHVWRNAAAGNKGGWQVARTLQFLVVLTGSVASEGGTALSKNNKFVPAPFSKPEPQRVWNELLYPVEWPLAHHELSFLLPHLVKEGRGKIDTYFTRVYNPVWTNPDGFSWIEMLQDEEQVGCHAALTPTWSETSLWADYVLPMGHSSERHDLMSQETHAGPLDRLPPAGPAGRQGARRRDRGVDPRSQPRRGLGGGRVLDRAVVAHRSRRQPGRAPALRVAVPPGRADHDRGVLPLDLREQRARPARGRRRRGPVAARVHAPPRRLRGRRRGVPHPTRRRAASAPRRRSWSSSRRRWWTGASRTTRCPAMCARMCIRPSAPARTSSRWCRPSACRP